MKAPFLLLLLLCSQLYANAQRPAGAVTVRSAQPVFIAIDNRLYNFAGTELTIANIPRGTHNLKIYAARYRSDKAEPGYLAFETFVRVRPDASTVAVWDPQSRTLRIGKEPMQLQQGQPSDNSYGRDEGQEGVETDDIYRQPAAATNGTEAAQPRLPYQLTDEQLQDLATQISSLPSDTKKSEVLQNVLGMKTYTVAQLHEIGGWLSFESERLAFLKWAYANTEDKDNYGQLQDLFRYESSKKELRDYVAQQKQAATAACFLLLTLLKSAAGLSF